MEAHDQYDDLIHGYFGYEPECTLATSMELCLSSYFLLLYCWDISNKRCPGLSPRGPPEALPARGRACLTPSVLTAVKQEPHTPAPHCCDSRDAVSTTKGISVEIDGRAAYQARPSIFQDCGSSFFSGSTGCGQAAAHTMQAAFPLCMLFGS